MLAAKMASLLNAGSKDGIITGSQRAHWLLAVKMAHVYAGEDVQCTYNIKPILMILEGTAPYSGQIPAYAEGFERIFMLMVVFSITPCK